jgi:hypothetical protein
MGREGETWEERRGRDLRAAASSSLDFQKPPLSFPEEKCCSSYIFFFLSVGSFLFFFLSSA